MELTGIEQAKWSAERIQNAVKRDIDKKQALITRMNDDYKEWELTEYVLTEFDDGVTFNEPRIFADTVMQILTAANLQVFVKRDDKKQKLESKIEKLCFATVRRAVEICVLMLEPKIQQAAQWYGAIRGIIAGRWLWITKDDGSIDPGIKMYDPRFLSWSVGEDGLQWTGYCTWRDPDTIIEDYGTNIPALYKNGSSGDYNPSIRVIEFITKTEYYVVIGDQVVKYKQHNLGYVPVVIVACSQTPIIVQEGQAYAKIANFGESIYAGSRGLNKIINKALTIWLSLIVKAHKQGGFVIGDGIELNKIPSPYGKEEMQVLPSGTTVQMIEPPAIAQTTPAFIEFISQAVQRNDFAWLRYGQLWKGQELSKVAIAELKEGTEKVLVPILDAMQEFYKAGLTMLVRDFMKNDYRLSGWGYDSKKREFREDFNGSVMSGKFDLVVKFNSITPEQEVSNYQKAQLIRDGNWASGNYVRENIIQFSDTQNVEEGLADQDAEMLSPRIKLMRIIKKLEGMDDKKTEIDILKTELARVELTNQINDAKMKLELSQMQQQVPVLNPQTEAGEETHTDTQPQRPPETLTEEDIIQKLQGVMGGTAAPGEFPTPSTGGQV